MDVSQYRDRVDVERRNAGLSAVDAAANGFDELWSGTDEDPTLGEVYLLATVVDAAEHDADDLEAVAERFRETLLDRVRGQDGSRTPLGYLVFCGSDLDGGFVEAATTYTVAERRTNVFPLVYDAADGTLHSHDVPRLKGRGIYRRQADDAERIFDV